MAIVSISYMGMKNRRFDVFSLMIISTWLFGFALFSGKVHSPISNGSVSIPDEVYYGFTLLLMYSLLASIIYDHSNWTKKTNNSSLNTGLIIFNIYFVIVSINFYLILKQYGFVQYFLISKRSLADQAGFIVAVFGWNLTVLMVLSYTSLKRKSFIVFYAACCLLSLVTANRTPIAISALSILLLIANTLPRSKIVTSHPTKVVGFIVGVMTLSFMKPLYSYYRAGKLNQLLADASSEGIIEFLGRGSEFLRSQATFSIIVEEGYKSSLEDYFTSFFSILPVPRSWLGGSSNKWSTDVQSTLFPYHDSGLAGNFIAEAFTTFGPHGIHFTSLLTIFVLILPLQVLLRKSKRAEMKVMLSILLVILAFYSFRNSLGVTLGFIRNILWPMLIVIYGAKFLFRIKMLLLRKI